MARARFVVVAVGSLTSRGSSTPRLDRSVPRRHRATRSPRRAVTSPYRHANPTTAAPRRAPPLLRNLEAPGQRDGSAGEGRNACAGEDAAQACTDGGAGEGGRDGDFGCGAVGGE